MFSDDMEFSLTICLFVDVKLEKYLTDQNNVLSAQWSNVNVLALHPRGPGFKSWIGHMYV